MNLELLESISGQNIFHDPLFYEQQTLGKPEIHIVGDPNNPKAVWPFIVQEKLGIKYSVNTFLQPYTGPVYLYPPDQKAYAKQSFEMSTTEELLSHIPKLDFFQFTLPPDYDSHFGFHLHGFKQTTHYTHILELNPSAEELFQNMHSNRRRLIKRAEEEHLSVEFNQNYELLCECHQSSKGKPLSHDEKAIIKGLVQKEKGICGFTFNKKNKCTSYIFILWDQQQAYYLLGSRTTRNQSNDHLSFSLLMWKSILFSKEKTPLFNFEGSMTPGIEQFYRSYGGEMKPYHVIQKSKNPLFEFLFRIKGFNVI